MKKNQRSSLLRSLRNQPPAPWAEVMRWLMDGRPARSMPLNTAPRAIVYSRRKQRGRTLDPLDLKRNGALLCRIADGGAEFSAEPVAINRDPLPNAKKATWLMPRDEWEAHRRSFLDSLE